MREIPLTRGCVALVDDEDYERLEFYHWHTWAGGAGTVYAGAHINGRHTLMHRFILDLGPGRIPEVDHRNGNGLDNRRENLRACERWQNMGNTRPWYRRKFKGVSRAKREGRWRAYIKIEYGQKGLGAYDTEEQAARAYDVAAAARFGDFARLNFPDELEESKRLIASLYKIPPKRLTTQERADLIRAREECELSFKQLGKAFGISQEGARKICRQAGMDTHHTYRKRQKNVPPRRAA